MDGGAAYARLFGHVDYFARYADYVGRIICSGTVAVFCIAGRIRGLQLINFLAAFISSYWVSVARLFDGNADACGATGIEEGRRGIIVLLLAWIDGRDEDAMSIIS